LALKLFTLKRAFFLSLLTQGAGETSVVAEDFHWGKFRRTEVKRYDNGNNHIYGRKYASMYPSFPSASTRDNSKKAWIMQSHFIPQ